MKRIFRTVPNKITASAEVSRQDVIDALNSTDTVIDDLGKLYEDIVRIMRHSESIQFNDDWVTRAEDAMHELRTELGDLIGDINLEERNYF